MINEYDILYSITAHESCESLTNLIENTIKFNPKNKILICLHLNTYMHDNFICNWENVIINKIYYDKKIYTHHILKAHGKFQLYY